MFRVRATLDLEAVLLPPVNGLRVTPGRRGVTIEFGGEVVLGGPPSVDVHDIVRRTFGAVGGCEVRLAPRQTEAVRIRRERRNQFPVGPAGPAVIATAILVSRIRATHDPEAVLVAARTRDGMALAVAEVLRLFACSRIHACRALFDLNPVVSGATGLELQCELRYGTLQLEIRRFRR